MRYYLGLDNGGTVTKAGLYSGSGEEIALASIRTKSHSPKPGFVERDMDEMREANFEVIRLLLEKAGAEGKDVAGVACCGHGKGLYLWGKDGRPVRPGILSSDSRALDRALLWKKEGVAGRVFAKTYQNLLACQPPALLAWLKENEAGAIDSTRWIFECKDYVRFCLTGEARAELTDYSGANLVNLATRAYDAELLELFGLSEVLDRLPPLCASTDQCGSVTPAAAERSGLAAGTPVFGGMFDIDACAVAVDAVSEDIACVIAGTWGINEYIRRTPVADGSVMMNSIFCLPEYYLAEESSPTSAGNLEWFIDKLLPEARMAAEERGASVYDLVNAWVRELPYDAACPFFFPFLSGSNAHPRAEASLVGLTGSMDRRHIAKAIYEGIAYSHRRHLDRLVASRGKPFAKIRLAGGLANSEEWVRLFADTADCPVEIAEIKETGTLGCALNVAVGLGDCADFGEAARKMVRIREPLEPMRARAEHHRRRYGLYGKISSALDPLWDEVALNEAISGR